MERQNAVHSCSVLSRTESFGSVLTTQRMLLANPEVEVSVSSPEYAWIRLHGKTVFKDNKSVKEGCMNNPIVKGQYQTSDNPIFEVFYLENPHGLIARDVKAHSDPGVVFKFFSASQQSMRSI